MSYMIPTCLAAASLDSTHDGGAEDAVLVLALEYPPQVAPGPGGSGGGGMRWQSSKAASIRASASRSLDMAMMCTRRGCWR